MHWVLHQLGTVEFFKSKGYNFPPEYGPLAAVTPGTAGGLCLYACRIWNDEFERSIGPAMQLAAGYP